MNILLLMSGSIACAKATGLISAWVKQGHEVEVACTHSVAQFVGHATLEGFSGKPVLGDAFASGRAMDHIYLAQWAIFRLSLRGCGRAFLLRWRRRACRGG